MALRDLIVNGVKLLDSVTNNGKLQTTVQYRRGTGTDFEGTVTFDPPVDQPAIPLRAVVEWVRRQVKTPEGVLDTTSPLVTILDLAGLTAASGGVGLTTSDSIVLPDGTTGPLNSLRGFLDPVTGQPFSTEARIGSSASRF